MRYEHGKVVPHLTVEERVARGKAARREVPRASHADFAAGTYRPDPVALLESQAATRVPSLVPIRYGRMLVSPFTFYRGAALIMAADLAGTPRSGITTQLCGDAHLMNFGVFASPERRLVFGINDLDETHPGPWEWDVKRLAASFAIAGRDNGYSTKERAKVLLTLVGSYRSAMHEFAAMSNLAVWYSHMDVETAINELRSEIDPAARKRADASFVKARTRDSLQAFDKLTHVVDGQRRIISNPPLVEPIEDLFDGDRSATNSRRFCAASCAATDGPCRAIDVTCSRSSAWLTWLARSWVWGASAPGRGSSCCSVGTTTTHCSCKPKKRRLRCSRNSSGTVNTYRMANAWSTANISCKQAATSSWVGIKCTASTASNATITSANFVTGRGPRLSRR